MLDQLSDAIHNTSTYTELRWQENSYTRVAMRRRSLIDNTVSTMSGVSARCFDAGCFGFASSPGQSCHDVTRVMTDARRNVNLLTRRRRITEAVLPASASCGESFNYRSPIPPLSPNQRIDAIRTLDDYVAKTYPGLLNVDLVLGALVMEKSLVTTEGTATYSYFPRTTMHVNFTVQANDGLVELHDTLGGFGDEQEHLSDVSSFFPQLDRLYEELRVKAEGSHCSAGVTDVILDASISGLLAHEAIGHTCEADLVLGGSVAADKLGKQVASDKITLVDTAGRGLDGGSSLAIHVDDEGTVCEDVTIIDKGVLKSFLTSKDTARKLDMAPTGNARAFRFNDEPLVRMRNTAICSGHDTLEQMISAIDHGYYFKRATNGQADATSEFMFGVAYGYEIKNGTLARAVRDTTISGVAFDVLESVSHVGDELRWSRGGWCGKKQLIPVGMGGPAIKCRVHVGGR